MFLLFWLMWLLFNERVTLEIALIGLPVSFLVDLFCHRIIGKPGHKSLKTHAKMLYAGARYALFMLGQIFISNFAVIRLILSPSLEPEPELHIFRTKLRTDAARVALSNSITITPGTITCTLEDDELTVHALDTSFAEGLVGGEAEKRLSELEDIAHDA